MAEEQKQAQPEQQDGSKTLVSFVVGLLIGGMLVWAFSGPSDHKGHGHDDDHAEEAAEEVTAGDDTATPAETADTETEETPSLPTGDGSITVNDQPASAIVALDSATYPVSEGWIGVRDYNNGQLGFILGVVRFSEAAGLVPESIVLQRSTVAGENYAVVVFEEDGTGGFNPAGDVQIDEIFATFTAQ